MTVDPVFEIRPNVQFEWCQLSIYRHPTYPQRYAAFSASGCSCNSFSAPTDVELAAAEPLDRVAARLRLTNFLRDYHHYLDAGATVRYLERFETTMTAEQP